MSLIFCAARRSVNRGNWVEPEVSPSTSYSHRRERQEGARPRDKPTIYLHSTRNFLTGFRSSIRPALWVSRASKSLTASESYCPSALARLAIPADTLDHFTFSCSPFQDVDEAEKAGVMQLDSIRTNLSAIYNRKYRQLRA